MHFRAEAVLKSSSRLFPFVGTNTALHRNLHYIYVYIYMYIYIYIYISSLCNHIVPWLVEGLSMLLPHLPILCYPLPDCTRPVSRSRLVHLQCLAGLPLGLFLDMIIQWRRHTDNIEHHLVDKNESKNYSPKLFCIFGRAIYQSRGFINMRDWYCITWGTDTLEWLFLVLSVYLGGVSEASVHVKWHALPKPATEDAAEATDRGGCPQTGGSHFILSPDTSFVWWGVFTLDAETWTDRSIGCPVRMGRTWNFTWIEYPQNVEYKSNIESNTMCVCVYIYIYIYPVIVIYYNDINNYLYQNKIIYFELCMSCLLKWSRLPKMHWWV